MLQQVQVIRRDRVLGACSRLDAAGVACIARGNGDQQEQQERRE
jgi:hypothetical protein